MPRVGKSIETKGLPDGSVVKNLPANAGDTGDVYLWVRKISWRMATHSSILAWKIPWTEESGGLQSMGSQKVGHDCAANTLSD